MPLPAPLRRFVHRVLDLIGIRERLIPYRHEVISRDQWDSAYAAGRWDYLRSMDQRPHYMVIAGYVDQFQAEAAVLDVGCGEGLLQELLERLGYRQYVGIDLSREAIARAEPRANERTRFECTDLLAYTNDRSFDVVILNECLYYFEDPAAALAHCDALLREGGVLVVSIYRQREENERLWKLAERSHRVLDEITLENAEGKGWTVKVLAPR